MILENQKNNNAPTDDDDGSDDEFIKTRKAEIFVDFLIKSDEIEGCVKFSDQEIVDQSLTFLGAGHISSSVAISMAVIYSAMHPEMQERAYREIAEVVGDSGEVTYDHMQKMEFVDRVLRETLRHAPTAPVVSRIVTADTSLDGVLVPAGTHILMSFANLHRHPKYWGPNADDFNPDNFLPENVAARHPFSYLPFSGGIRNCIANKYSLITLKSMYANLLMAYKFSTPLKMKDLEFHLDITMTITNPHLVEITQR